MGSDACEEWGELFRDANVIEEELMRGVASL